MRANYSNFVKGISPTSIFLHRFFENLLFDGKHELKNREMHICYKVDTLKAENDTVKMENDTVKEGNETVLSLIKQSPSITAEQMRIKLGVSIATVKRETKRLKDAGIIERIGSDKTGCWKVKGGGV